MSSSAHEQYPPAELRRQAAPGFSGRPVLVRSQAPAKPGDWWLVGVLMLSALLIRLPSLSGTSLWLDEIWSIASARLPWPKLIWLIVHQDSNASLYYVVLHMWMHLGSSELIVRSLSVMLGVITIPFLYSLGNRLYGKPVGLLASVLLIVNRMHVQQSQDSRAYALLMLLTTLLSLVFVRCIEQPSLRHWSLYSLLAVLACYAHVFATLVLTSHLVSLLFLRRKQIDWRGVLGSAAAILALTAPLGYILLQRENTGGGPLSWVPPLSVGSFIRIFWALAGGSHFGSRWLLIAGMALSAGYGLLCLNFARWTLRQLRQHGRSLPAWHAAMVLTWLVLPIVLATLVSFKAPVLIDKYLIVTTPALMLSAAKGMQLLRPKLHVPVAAAMVCLAVIALVAYLHVRGNDHEWQSVTNLLASEARPGDAVLFMVAPGRLMYEYYRGEEHGQRLAVLYPRFEPDFKSDPASLLYLPPLSQASLNQWTSQYRRIWVVLYHDQFWDSRPKAEQIQRSLSAKYQKIEDRLFVGTPFFERAEVQLYSRDGRERNQPISE